MRAITRHLADMCGSTAIIGDRSVTRIDRVTPVHVFENDGLGSLQRIEPAAHEHVGIHES